MERKRLEELAEKYFSGTASQNEKEELHKWYDDRQTYPDEVVRVQSGDTKEEVRLRMFYRLKEEIRKGNEKKWKPAWRIKVAAAAAILLITALGIILWGKVNQNEWIVIQTSYGELKDVVLPDSSTVWMNAGTKFRYPRRFDNKERKVELVTGQAFFEVERDENRPFYVETPDMKVEVLGTSFDVKSYEGESSARVSVLTGNVDVSYNGGHEHSTVNLVRGEQAILDLDRGNFSKEKTSEEAIAAWKDGRLVFEDESMSNVMNALERRYDIEIVGEKAEWNSETISIKLDNQPLDDVLEVLKYTMDFNYKKIEKEKIEIMK